MIPDVVTKMFLCPLSLMMANALSVGPPALTKLFTVMTAHHQQLTIHLGTVAIFRGVTLLLVVMVLMKRILIMRQVTMVMVELMGRTFISVKIICIVDFTILMSV